MEFLLDDAFLGENAFLTEFVAKVHESGYTATGSPHHRLKLLSKEKIRFEAKDGNNVHFPKLGILKGACPYT